MQVSVVMMATLVLLSLGHHTLSSSQFDAFTNDNDDLQANAEWLAFDAWLHQHTAPSCPSSSSSSSSIPSIHDIGYTPTSFEESEQALFDVMGIHDLLHFVPVDHRMDEATPLYHPSENTLPRNTPPTAPVPVIPLYTEHQRHRTRHCVFCPICAQRMDLSRLVMHLNVKHPGHRVKVECPQCRQVPHAPGKVIQHIARVKKEKKNTLGKQQKHTYGK